MDEAGSSTMQAMGARQWARAGVSVLLAAALGLSLGPGCAPEERPPLRIAVNVWPPYELFYLARERGFFRDQGVQVELVDFSSYSGVLRAYHQGQIDGLLASLNEIQVKDNFQDPPAVVLTADYSAGGDALIARPEFRGVADLRGRRVAYEESALGSYMLERSLAAGGLTPADVVLSNRLPEESEADFNEGRVDAVVTYEPFLGRLVQGGSARVLASTRDMPGEIVDVLALRRSVIRGRGDQVRALVRAWFMALNDLHADPAAAAAVMARREGLSPEEFLRALDSTVIPDRRENLRLLGTTRTPGDLHRVADRLGEFLLRRGLARDAARGSEILDGSVLESL
jgi:NitT/TauT family transport system substrate-binding protein